MSSSPVCEEVQAKGLSEGDLAALNAAHLRLQSARGEALIDHRILNLFLHIGNYALDLEGALDQVCKELGRLEGIAGAAVALEHDGMMRCWARWGEAPDLGVRVDDRSAFTRQAVESKQMVLCEASEALRGYPNTGSVLIVPLLEDEVVTGLIVIHCQHGYVLGKPCAHSLIEVAKGIQLWCIGTEETKDRLRESRQPPKRVRMFISQVRRALAYLAASSRIATS